MNNNQEIYYFCCMKYNYCLIYISICFLLIVLPSKAQIQQNTNKYLVPMCIYQGDTIPSITLRTVYIFKPLVFKNNRERRDYYRLVYNLKKVYPLSVKINNIVIETYEFIETLPDEKAKNKHISRVEKGLKEQYSKQFKKLSYTQGKLLIKLVDRESNQTSYDLIKAFMGPFKAGFYQIFASAFHTSLKKTYDPNGDDKMIERIVIQIENGQL